MSERMEYLTEPIAKLFQQLADGPAAGRASVKVSNFVDHDSVELLPSNPRAARIVAIIPKKERYPLTLAAGKGTIFEIPEMGGRYTETNSVLDEARILSQAVIGGRFSEKVKSNIKDEVVSSMGTVDLPPPITVRWGKLTINPFQRTSVEDLHYEPY